jgi:toxin ParE1/3/4
MVDRRYEIEWSNRANRALDEIHAYIAADNPSAADRLIGKITSRVAQLESIPRLGTPYPDGSQPLVRQLIVKPYRIFYRIHEERLLIQILDVWHSARREPEKMGWQMFPPEPLDDPPA